MGIGIGLKGKYTGLVDMEKFWSAFSSASRSTTVILNIPFCLCTNWASEVCCVHLPHNTTTAARRSCRHSISSQQTLQVTPCDECIIPIPSPLWNSNFLQRWVSISYRFFSASLFLQFSQCALFPYKNFRDPWQSISLCTNLICFFFQILNPIIVLWFSHYFCYLIWSIYCGKILKHYVHFTEPSPAPPTHLF